MATQSNWYPTTFTLGTGVRVTNITVTTTPTSLNALLNTAVSGRSSMSGRRSLKLLNMDSSNPFYIVESVAQGGTPSNGYPVDEGTVFAADASETFTENIGSIDVSNGGGGFYLCCSAGTIAVKVLEAK